MLIEAKFIGDDRGFFAESWQRDAYSSLGLDIRPAQINLSQSERGVLRGLHFQEPFPQGKLVWVPQGKVFDVAVDIRRSSPTFGQWWGAELSSDNAHQLWIPPGFAHGFEVLSDSALFAYLCTDVYRPEFDRSIAWNDPEISIPWQTGQPSLSAKDAAAPRLTDFPRDLLPN